MPLRWRDCGAPPGCQPPRAATPDGSVVYAIGDIHGCADLLHGILEGVVDDARRRDARRRVLVLLGDYATRGPRIREAVDTLAGLALPGFEIVALKGNGEDAMLRYLDGDLALGAHWFDYGGDTFLAAFGLNAPHRPLRRQADLDALRWQADDLPDYGTGIPGLAGQDLPAIESLRRGLAAALVGTRLEFFRRLPIAHREGGYCFVHAGILPGVALEQQPDRPRMWIRRRFLDSELDHGAVIVHGHSISAEPEVRPNRIGIDTGAYQSGVLTCLVLDGEERRFLQTC